MEQLNLFSPPEDAWTRKDFQYHCTCDKYDWPEVLDPYQEEINNEEVWIKVCPYCYNEIAMDI